MAGQVLAAAGADLERVRAEVVRLLAEYQQRKARCRREPEPGEPGRAGGRRAYAGRGNGLGTVRYERI